MPNNVNKNSYTDIAASLSEDKDTLEKLVNNMQTKEDDMELGNVVKDSSQENTTYGIIKEKNQDIHTEMEESRLRYRLRDNPPIPVIIMGALQHILLSMSGCLSTSMVVADVACIPFDHPIRSHLFCSTIFMVGICTIMETALGVRLPIFQGPSSSFLVPLLALQRDPKWQCSPLTKGDQDHHIHDNATTISNSSATTDDDGLFSGIMWRLQEMSGALLVASLIEILLGLTGLLKIMLHFIGPITIACTISLIGVSLFKLPIIYGKPNFPMAIACMVLVMIFVLYLNRVSIPLPKCGKDSQSRPRRRFPLFQLIPILLSVIIVWIAAWILTACGVFTDNVADDEYLARADAKLSIITNSRWFQLSYPGQFGPPRMNFALTLGFLVACFSSVIESVGDYYAAQRVCQTPKIPDHAISRGILMEGIGSIISASVGVGHATTSYSGNIAVLTLTKTASRVIMYTAAVILLVVSLFGKAGAALTTIPNPILGGVMMVISSSLLSIGLANLRHVDMSSSRNLIVFGVPFMSGIVIPACLDMYPTLINTGNEEADRVINVVLGTPMFFGGLFALILDTTVPGYRHNQHVTHTEENEEVSGDSEEDEEVYSWSIYPRILLVCPFLEYLPFLPKSKSLNLVHT